jgi:UDP-N-acetylmuramate dehydrogenase
MLPRYLRWPVLTLRERVPLAPLTTLGVGGLARFFVEAHTPDDVQQAVAHSVTHSLPLFVLGGGSNLVVADTGWPGLVLQIDIRGISQSANGAQVTFSAGAGEGWDNFVSETVAADCAGMECLSGIPGTVGGTPVQNVGAYGQEVSDTIVSVTAFDREARAIREFSNEDCGFAYRTSIFNTSQRERFIVLQVAYALQRGAPPKIEYADLKRFFADRPSPSLQAVRDAVREIRQMKGMLLVDGDPDVRSAGSFFKNPIVSSERFEALQAEMQARGLQLPSYPAGQDQRKLSAAWLVEKAGFHKGYSHGNVGVSSKHTLALINRGGAKASEIVSFMNVIRETVFSRFQIDLHPEPVFVGFEKSPVMTLS